MIRLADSLRISTHPNGMVVFDTRNGKIFSANTVGARILDLIRGGCDSPDQIEAQISKEFGTPAEVVSTDVTKFIESLKSRGLVIPCR